jgi:hypothetical protein
LASVFLAHGVQVWLPELDGLVDLTEPANQALIIAPPTTGRTWAGANARWRPAMAGISARHAGQHSTISLP